MSTALWLSANSSARVASPTAKMASWGHAGRQRPTRVQASSTIQTFWSSTATASEGHTRTQARHAAHNSGSILKSAGAPARRERLLNRGFGAGLIYRVFLEFAIEGPLTDSERLGRLAAIAVRLAQRGVDRRALHIRHGHPRFVDHRLIRFGRCIERIERRLDLSTPSRTSTNLDSLHPLCRALLDPPPQRLKLHLQFDERTKDELQLLAPGSETLPRRRRDPHRQCARALPDVARNVRGTDLALGREHHHRLDEILELAHVAGPVGIDEDLQRVGCDTAEIAVMLLRELRDERPDQQRDVAAPLAQR